MDEKRLKILIVTHYFPPLNKVGSLRTFSWAKYWSRMGHNICVLTTKKEWFDGNLNLNIDPIDIETIKVEEVSYLPIKILSKPKSREKQELTYSQSNNSLYIDEMKNLLRKLRRYIGSTLDIHDLWILPAVRKALEIYKNWSYEVIVSSYGPQASHIVAGILKRLLHVFWVADYRDLWYGNHIFSGKWPFSIIEKNIEDYFVKKADLITVVSDPLREKLISRFGDKVVTIENGFDHEEIKNIENKEFFPKDGKIRLVYTGTIYPQKRDPSPLFEAINILRNIGFEVDKKLEVIFYGNDLGNLRELIKEYKVGNIVKTPGFVDRITSLQAQRSADGLIFLEWEDPSANGVLTGKLFEYMFSGRPIIGIGVSSKTAPGKLIEVSGTGIALGRDSMKIAEMLRKLLSGERINYSPSQEYLNKYTREVLAEKMLKEIIKGIEK
jgi:hypothetical protein